MIAAVSPEGVIGLHGQIPWRRPADLHRFKRITVGKTVIMGKNTWNERKRPLPGRRNVVVTKTPIEGVECFATLREAVASCTGEIWLIGGAGIYREGMELADVIDLTYVPDHIGHPDAVRFPPIDAARFEAGPRERHPDDPELELQRFHRR